LLALTAITGYSCYPYKWPDPSESHRVLGHDDFQELKVQQNNSLLCEKQLLFVRF